MKTVITGEDLPTEATASNAMMITGIAEIASRIRMTIMSKMPLKYPAARPMVAPTIVPSAVAKKEMTMINRAPMMTREKMSCPSWSVPNQYLPDGGA